MSLSPGSMIGPFKLRSLIGKGGMGEVFSAVDTRLDRAVALKLLPFDLDSDPDRLRRFNQEAKTLASLNHPNILVIHEVGSENTRPYLVSELLEGHSLREELNGNPLPLRKSTDYALQVANGLAAAHARGIIHRDLKPENIFITKDGRVKILDFGLAKLQPQVAEVRRFTSLSADQSAPPHLGCNDPEAATLLQSTVPGLILGTPAYMSPEQVRGDPADHRSDIFAFGCVLYEMLFGVRAFGRETAVETMTAVLNEDPPEVTTASASLSPALERIFRRCLAKELQRRFQSADDLAFALENATAGGTGAFARPKTGFLHGPGPVPRLLPWALAALALMIAASSFLLSRGPIAIPAEATATVPWPLRKFELTLPAPERSASEDNLFPVIAPDGQKLAYVDGNGLWLRWLDRTAPPLQLVASEKIACPFWSPDSTEIGYFEGAKILRIAINGGQPVLLGRAPQEVSGGAGGGGWLNRDRIVFGTGGTGLYEVAADGGKVREICPPAEGEIDFHNPSPLPEGRGVLLIIHGIGGIDSIGLWSSNGTRKTLLQIPGNHLWNPVYSATGHILFERADEGRGVWAFGFSLEELERTSEPFRVSDVGRLPSVARDGTLVLSLAKHDAYSHRQLTWVSRAGVVLDSFGPALPGLSQPRISPDGRRVIASAGEMFSEMDIWLIDIGGGSMALSRHAAAELMPEWKDPQSVVFVRKEEKVASLIARDVNLVREEFFLQDVRETTSSGNLRMHLSSSGNFLILRAAPLTGKGTAGYVPLAGPRPSFIPFSEFSEPQQGWCLSPDDRLLAFHSELAGQKEVYVAEFPGSGAKILVSRSGGRHPNWHPSGKELFYMSNDGRALWSAKLKQNGRGFEEPSKLFDLPESIHGGLPYWPDLYDVAPDGERFLMLRKVADPSAPVGKGKPNVLVVQNWIAEFPDKE